MRDDHDIVIADPRGTSGPSRLDCDMSNAALGAAEYLNTLFPKDKSRILTKFAERSGTER
jgi:hypothetical protein